jgi:hypothetical protein
VLAVVGLVSVVVVACSAESDEALPGVTGGGAGIGGLLGSLPVPSEQDEPVVVAYGDLARAAEIAGVEPPSDPSDQEAVLRYVNAVTGGPVPDDGEGGEEGEDGPTSSSPVAAVPPSVAHAERAVDIEEFADDVGWTILQVDRFIERQNLPDAVTVLDGRFDRDSLDDALGETEDGAWVAGDGEAGALNPDEATAARPLGEPLWLSLDDQRLVVTRSAEDMAAARDADGGEGTLADDAVLAALADALDEEAVYTALLHDGPLESAPGGREASPEQREELCDEALAEGPAGVASGLADDDGPVIVLALVHDDPDAAEANAAAIERMVEEGVSFLTAEPWSERLTLDEVTADGAVTVARLRPLEQADADMWRQILVNQDSLLASC